MNTLTIPKKLMNQGDLVVMPRTEYERLLDESKRRSQSSNKLRKLYAQQLDKDLNKSIREYKHGKAIGPFSSIAELKKSLEIGSIF